MTAAVLIIFPSVWSYIDMIIPVNKQVLIKGAIWQKAWKIHFYGNNKYIHTKLPLGFSVPVTCNRLSGEILGYLLPFSHHQDLKGTSNGNFTLTGNCRLGCLQHVGMQRRLGRAATTKEFGVHCCCLPLAVCSKQWEAKGGFGFCHLFHSQVMPRLFLWHFQHPWHLWHLISHFRKHHLPPGGPAFVHSAGQPISAGFRSAPQLSKPVWCWWGLGGFLQHEIKVVYCTVLTMWFVHTLPRGGTICTG